MNIEGSAQVSIVNTTIHGNQASYGGGIYIGCTAQVSIVNTAIYGNQAPYGGGMYIGGSAQVNITDTAIHGNQARTSGVGGGIYIVGTAQVSIVDTAVHGNSALGGAAIYAITSVQLYINSTIFSSNEATGSGSALYWDSSGDSLLTNCSFSNHSAAVPVLKVNNRLRWHCPLGKWMPSTMEYPQDRDSPDFSGCFYACALGHYGTTPDLTTFACSGECPVGHRCPKGTSLPVPCPPGYHASNNGSTTCTPCGIGNSSSVPRAVDCEPCSRGSFSSLPGATACDRCAAGGYCAQVGAASASMTFEPCPVGTWSGAVGATSNATCESCPAGKANPITGSTERTCQARTQRFQDWRCVLSATQARTKM